MVEVVEIDNNSDENTVQNNCNNRESPYTMTEDVLKQRIKEKTRGRLTTQLCVTIAACTAALSFGTVLGWSRPSAKLDSKAHLNLTCTDYAWVVSLVPLGCSVGLTPSTYGLKTMGPKKTMILITPLYVSSFLIILRAPLVSVYIGSRFFAGFFGIGYLMSAEHLLIDSVHENNLACVVVFCRSALMLGIVVAYIIGNWYGKFNLTMTCAVIPTVNMLLLIILPESPVFLYDKHEEKAVKALQWYLGPKNIYISLKRIQRDSDLYRSGTESHKDLLFSKTVARGIFIVILLNFFRVCSGLYVFILYSILNHEPRLIVFNIFVDNIIFGMTLLLSNLLVSSPHFFNNFGVRKPLLLSSIIVTAALTVQTTYLYLLHFQYLSESFSRKYQVPLFTTISLVVGYEVGYSSCPDIILHDYLPIQIHRTAKLIVHTLYWFSIYWVTRYFLVYCNCTNHHQSFVVLAAVSFVGILYCYFFIIESKGKNLARIQMEIGGHPIGSRGARKYRLAFQGENAVH